MTTPTARYRITATDDSRAAFTSFRSRIQRATVAVAKFGALAGVAAAGALALMGSRALKAADEVAKLNRQTGLSTEFLSEMRGVSELVGIQFEQVSKGSRSLSRALFDAERGLKTQVEAFEELGVSIEKLARLSPDERFLEVVTALGAMESEFKRTALAMVLLGGRQEELIRLGALGRKEIEALRLEEVKRGNSLSGEQVAAAEAALDANTRLQKSIEGVVNQLTLKHAPAMAQMVDQLRTAVIPVVDFVANIFRLLGSRIGGVAATLVQVAQGNFTRAFEITKEMVREQNKIIDELFTVATNPSKSSEEFAAKNIARSMSNAVSRAKSLSEQTLKGSFTFGPQPLSEAELKKLNDAVKKRESAFKKDLDTVNQVISGIRQAIALRQELSGGRGSSAVVDVTLQSLRGREPTRDEETLRELKKIEAALNQRELAKLLREIKVVLERRGSPTGVFA